MAAGRTRNELTDWITFDRPAVDLQPHARHAAQVTIKVPPSAWKGERYGVIWAETGGQSDAAHNVRMVSRVGIRTYLDIGPGGEPPSDFRIEALTPVRAVDGRPQILARVHNTGGRALDMSGTLELSEGPSGLRAGPFNATTGTTLQRGDSAPVTVLLDKRLPDGPWKIRLTLTSGALSRTTDATVTFPHDPGGSGRTITISSRNVGAGIALAGAAALLAIVTVLVLRRRRSRRTGRPSP
jgi:hypothetical protein